MLLLKNVQSFGATREEMVHLWIIFCRSVLEQCAAVWSSSLTQENIDDLERTQKSFAKLVLKKDYHEENENSYENALIKLNLETLEQRRTDVCLTFAKNCVKNGIISELFSENKSAHDMETRHQEKYQVFYANNERMKKSSIIYMQNLLNADDKENNLRKEDNIKRK